MEIKIMVLPYDKTKGKNKAIIMGKFVGGVHRTKNQ